MSKKPVKIFLDVDGVVANVTDPALAYHGLTGILWPPGVYDMCMVTGMDGDAFWKPLMTEEFWATLPPTGDAYRIVTFLRWWAERWTRDVSIVFLSSISRKCTNTEIEACRKGKQLWVDKHFPGIPLTISIGSKGEFVSDDYDCILVDDFQDNLASFSSVGGTAILYPRPWNRGHEFADIALPILATSLRDCQYALGLQTT